MKKLYIKIQELDLFGENVKSELFNVMSVGIQDENCDYLYCGEMIKRDDDLPMLEQIVELINRYQHYQDEEWINSNYYNESCDCECCGSYQEIKYIYTNNNGDDVECETDTHFYSSNNWELTEEVIEFLEKSGYEVIIIK